MKIEASGHIAESYGRYRIRKVFCGAVGYLPRAMSEPLPPSRLGLAVEDLLSGWLVPGVALAAVAVVAALYLAGILAEAPTAATAVAVAGLLAALLMIRHAIAGRDRAGRLLAVLAAVATAALVVIPGLTTLVPGTPLFEGQLGQVGDQIPVPPGTAGAVRLLVSTRLPQGGAPSIAFRIGGGRAPIEGKVERTLSPTRVGRGARAMVAHDHSAEYLAAELPPGAAALRLERLQGEAAAPLTVQVFPERLGMGWLWALSAVVLALAAAADARLGGKDHAAAIAGMALSFALLVTANATPQAAVGPVLGGVLLGALAGALAGWVAGLVARRVVPAPSPAQQRRARE